MSCSCCSCLFIYLFIFDIFLAIAKHLWVKMKRTECQAIQAFFFLPNPPPPLLLLPPWEQGSTKVPPGRPGQVDFEVGQVTSQGHLPDGQALGQTYIKLHFKSVK